MEKDMIFFSKDGKGLTSTSAGHIANLAKEMIRETEASLDALALYSTSVALIGTDSSNTLSRGNTAEELNEVPDKLHTIARANALIAWLREAIKARENLLSEVESISFSDYLELKEIEKPLEPKEEHVLTRDEYFASLSLEERNRYYSLEALAAVLGKAVHPNGALAKAREMLNSKIRTPRKVEGDGRDALIYTFEASVRPAEMDEVYFKIQKQFRETQARLNAINFECQKAVKASQIASATKYAEDTARSTAWYKQIHADRSAYIKERTREISNYKIVIPDSLKDIYEEVAHLGKK